MERAHKTGGLENHWWRIDPSEALRLKDAVEKHFSEIIIIRDKASSETNEFFELYAIWRSMKIFLLASAMWLLVHRYSSIRLNFWWLMLQYSNESIITDTRRIMLSTLMCSRIIRWK